jgi:hypothetical protein
LQNILETLHKIKANKGVHKGLNQKNPKREKFESQNLINRSIATTREINGIKSCILFTFHTIA